MALRSPCHRQQLNNGMQHMCRCLPAKVQVLMPRTRPCPVIFSVHCLSSAWGEPGEVEDAWRQPHKHTCHAEDEWEEAWGKPSESSATRVFQVSEISEVCQTGTVALSKSTCKLGIHQRSNPLTARETVGANAEDGESRYNSACAVCRCKSVPLQE